MRSDIIAITIATLLAAAQPGSSLAADLTTHQVTGEILAMNGLHLTLKTRAGATAIIDASPAVSAERATLLRPGALITAQGDTENATGLIASVITRAKPDETAWPPDR